MTKDAKTNFLINTLFFTVVAIIIYFAVKFLYIYLLPFIIGTIITVLVQKPAAYVSERIKIKKGYCALLLVIIIYFALVATITLAILKIGLYLSEIANENSTFMSTISNMTYNFSKQLQKFENKIPPLLGEQISSLIKSFVNSIVGLVSDFAKNTAKSMPMFITTSVVTVIASCYIAKDFDRFKISILSVISEKYRYVISELKYIFKDNLLKVAIGYIKLLLITFIELILGLVLLRIDNALLIALVIAFLDLLPIIGTGTVLIPWGIYNLIAAEYFVGVGLLTIYAIITLVRNIIEPKIIGKQIGLHPLIALVAVFIGLKLFGFVGIIVLPLTIMLVYKIYEHGIFEILFQKPKN